MSVSSKSARIVNLFGGPGTGKSTTAAALFAELKRKQVDCELVTEFAKDLVWEEAYKVLANQIWVFGVQYHRIWRLLDKVDVIITDAPLLHSIIYNQGSETLNELVFQEHNKLSNINIFLQRTKKYVQNGRYHTEEQSLDIDRRILKMLDNFAVGYNNIPCEGKCEVEITEYILRFLHQPN